MRVTLNQENPLSSNDYPCFLQAILFEEFKLAEGIILNPFLQQDEHENEILDVYIDGFLFRYHLEKSVQTFVNSFFVNERGVMKILSRRLADDEGLMKRIHLVFDYFKTIKGN